MSMPAQKAQVDSHLDRQPNRSKQETRAILQQLDERLKQLSERVIPPQPYLLSIPSAYPYRYSSRFFNSWYIGTPFAPNEEELQYTSFLPHQEDYEALLRVVGGWSDSNGNQVEEEASPSTVAASELNTPAQQSNRKKISFKDYKTKDKIKESTPVPRVEIHETKTRTIKPEGRGGAKEMEDPKVRSREGHDPVKTELRPLHKNSIVKVEGARPSRSVIDTRHDRPSSPRKRRKLSPDTESPTDDQIKHESKEMKSLPALLSPTLPASERVRGSRDLPALLSPALPPALERAIAKAEAEMNGDALKRKEQVKSTPSEAPRLPAEKKLPTKELVDAGRVRSDSQTSLSATAPSRLLSPHVKPTVKVESRPSTPLQNASRPGTGPRQRRVIILKYGKKNRKRVESLLRLSSGHKKVKTTPEEPAVRQEITRPAALKSSTGAIKSVPEAIKPEKRRLAESSPERLTKKPKASSLLETPEKSKKLTQSAIKSPAPSSVTKPKIELATPRRDLKPSAMQRISSSDGMDIRTPPISTSTPISGAGPSQPKRSPAPGSTSAPREADRTAWQDLNQKYFALGRSLKREGSSYSEKQNEHDRALSAVLHVEAILCFMINLAASSYARPNIDPGWQSMLPYQIQIFKATRKYRQLHGLVIQLGAVCRQMWHVHNIDRLSRDPLPDEHCGSAPTPGSDGNTKTDDPEKYKKRYIDFRDQLVLNSRELQSAWLEGSRYLSPYLIERDYPKTWSKRMKDTIRRGTDRPNPNQVSKDFCLPLDSNSNAFEAVRFSLAFLEEWTTKEGIQWKSKIEL